MKNILALIILVAGTVHAQTRPLFVMESASEATSPIIVFKLPEPPKLTDRSTFLRMIHQVENPTNSRRPGAHGELGPFQFKPITWHQHTRLPFRLALDQATATAVAEIHYEWIKSALVIAGVRPTDYLIAAAWNRGVDASLRTWRSDYAQRVVNLCSTARGSGSQLAWILTR